MKSDEAVAAFRSGYNCAQSTFIPFARAAGLPEATAAKIASSFGAGMGRMQETCGAATGGMMALGLGRGFERPEDQAGKDATLARTKEFLALFKAEFGTHRCRDLIGCDLNTEEGQAFHRDQDQRELICAKCVGKAASLVEGLLERKA
jgi:C_GCAxxG_C_C family probable redox protein